jgi:hypothetical protein
MFNPTNVTFQALQVNAAKAASETPGLQLRFVEVRAPSAFEAAFDTVVQEQKRVLLILIDPLFIGNSKALAELFVKSRPITTGGNETARVRRVVWGATQEEACHRYAARA